MLSIAHVAAGSLISTRISNPLVSIPLILASHYLLDAIPHWDFGQGLSKAKKSKKAAFFQELLIDLPLSFLLVFFLFQYNKGFDYHIWLGWFFGLLPDFVEFPARFLKWHFFPFKQHQDFHHGIHYSIPEKIKGLIPQFLVILIVFLISSSTR